MALNTGGSGNLQALPSAATIPSMTLRPASFDAGAAVDRFKQGYMAVDDLKNKRWQREAAAELTVKEERAKQAADNSKLLALKADQEARTHESDIQKILADNSLGTEQDVQKLSLLKATAENTRNAAIADAQRNEVEAVQAAADAATVAKGASAERSTKSMLSQEQQNFLTKTAQKRAEDREALLQQGGVRLIEGDGFTIVETQDPTTSEIKRQVQRNPAPVSNKGKPVGKPYKDEFGNMLQDHVYPDGSTTPVIVAKASGGTGSSAQDKKQELADFDYVKGGGYARDIETVNDFRAAAEESGNASEYSTGKKGMAVDLAARGAARLFGLDPNTASDIAKDPAVLRARNYIMSASLAQLKSTFGGNPTEGERKVLIESFMAPGMTGSDIKKRLNLIADRAERTAKARREIAKYRMEHSGSLDGFEGEDPDTFGSIVSLKKSGPIELNETGARSGSSTQENQPQFKKGQRVKQNGVTYEFDGSSFNEVK